MSTYLFWLSHNWEEFHKNYPICSTFHFIFLWKIIIKKIKCPCSSDGDSIPSKPGPTRTPPGQHPRGTWDPHPPTLILHLRLLPRRRRPPPIAESSISALCSGTDLRTFSLSRIWTPWELLRFLPLLRRLSSPFAALASRLPSPLSDSAARFSRPHRWCCGWEPPGRSPPRRGTVPRSELRSRYLSLLWLLGYCAWWTRKCRRQYKGKLFDGLASLSD